MALKGRAAGFSLIELLIAMVVTMVIGGAILAMLIGGQDAFKVQPEISDMQQNGRAALDMIMRDVANAGSGLPATAQVFTRVNSDGSFLDGMGEMAPANEKTDELEIMYDNSGLGALPVCGNPGKSQLIRLDRPTTPIAEDGEPVLITIIMADGTWTVRQVTGKASNNGNDCPNKCKTTDVSGGETCEGTTSLSCTDYCDADSKHEQLDLNSGGDAGAYNPNGGGGVPKVCQESPSHIGSVSGADVNCAPEYVVMSDVIRYRIYTDPAADADKTPYLQRKSMLGGGEWRNVARGIEDLQVSYRQAGTTDFVGSPAEVKATAGVPDYSTLTVEVEVSLSARSELYNPKGGVHPIGADGKPVKASIDATDPAIERNNVRFRATFSSHVSPRSTLYAAAQAAATPVWQ